MSRKQPAQTGLLLTALLLAGVLQIVPIYGEAALWRPHYTLLVVIYFLLNKPLHYGIATAWLAGLCLDMIFGGVFGRYALSLGVSAYLFTLFRRRLQHAVVWHQCGLVFVLVAVAQVIVATVNIATDSDADWRQVWYTAFSSAVIWPVVAWLLRRVGRRRIPRK